MSKYTAKIKHKNGEDLTLYVGYDTNGKYFFYVIDKKENIIDGSYVSELSFEQVKEKAKKWEVKPPTIVVSDFRIIKRFDPSTGELYNYYVVMYLESKFDRIPSYMNISARTEEECIEIFNREYPKFHLVEIADASQALD